MDSAFEGRPDLYLMEFNEIKGRPKLPMLFSQRFLKTVPNKCILRDPNGNELNVGVEKEGDDAVFTDGWNHLGAFYGIQPAGWLQMVYLSTGVFSIEVMNQWGEKVTYPPMPDIVLPGNSDTNPIVLDFDDVVKDEEPLPNIVDRSRCIIEYRKWLTYDEFIGRKLTFDKKWAAYYLPEKDGTLTIVDEYGKYWPCYFKTDLGDDATSGILKGWCTFCRNKKLFQGQAVRFGVLEPNSNVLYFTPSL